MNGLASARGAGSAALRGALLAAMLMLAAGTSQAAPEGGRGAGHGGRTYARGNGRTHGGGGDRSYGGGDRSDGGGNRSYGGGDRSYGGGNRSRGVGSDRSYGGGGRPYVGGGGQTYVDRGGLARSGGTRDYGGARYHGGARYYGGARYCGGASYYEPYVYRYVRPRPVVSFGIGLGVPYSSPPVYRYEAEPQPVVVGPVASVDVTNEPPAGCYYYDRFCDRRFSNLDEYTDHLQGQDHAKTIEVVQEESGAGLRTLELVDGYWNVME